MVEIKIKAHYLGAIFKHTKIAFIFFDSLLEARAEICKVYIFWEGPTILQNLRQLFVLCTASQIIGGDFAKFCGLHRIYEL